MGFVGLVQPTDAVVDPGIDGNGHPTRAATLVLGEAGNHGTVAINDARDFLHTRLAGDGATTTDLEVVLPALPSGAPRLRLQVWSSEGRLFRGLFSEDDQRATLRDVRRGTYLTALVEIVDTATPTTAYSFQLRVLDP